MKEFSNVFDERGEHRICSDSAEPEKQRMQFNVYFLGIGGIGMSALARYFLHEGRRVAGYDRVRSHLTDQIEAEGAVVHYEEDPAQIPVDFRDPATTIVVYTPAVPADHAELRWFRQNGFEIVKRSQMLGYLSQGKFVMAVAGTHGKTTTTTLVAYRELASETWRRRIERRTRFPPLHPARNRRKHSSSMPPKSNVRCHIQRVI